jgi:DNA repair protein RadC
VPIRSWPESTRPRERLLARGAAALADAELVALLIGSGTATRSALDVALAVIRALGGLRGLARADPVRIAAAGVGTAATARILAACELGRRVTIDAADGERCDTRERAAAALAPHFAHLEREALVVALLSRTNRLVGVVPLYNGHVSGTSLRIAELFTEAVRRNAPAIMIAHNHPSGDPTPSADDRATTRDAIAAGRLLGIDVVDHLVFGAGRWASAR